MIPNRHKLVLYIKLGQFVNYSSKHKAILRVTTLHSIDLLATINKHMYVHIRMCVQLHVYIRMVACVHVDCVCACDCEHASANTSQMLFVLSTRQRSPNNHLAALLLFPSLKAPGRMETGHATAKAVRLADTSKPPTHSEALSIKHPTRCTHLPPASQRVWSI